MICYPENATDAEIAALNDYWLLSEETSTGFLYTLKKIDECYKSDGARPVSTLTQKSLFLVQHPSFFCQDCNCKAPVKSRKEYTERVKRNNFFICSHCADLRHQRLVDEAKCILKKFKENIFQAYPYLDNLNILESISLLAISKGKQGRGLISETANDVAITGIYSVDKDILQSLINKKALVHIDELPLEVQDAENLLYGAYKSITYDNRFRKPVRYRSPDSIISGVYLNALILDDSVEIENLTPILYQKVMSVVFSYDDISKVHQLIKNIQLEKLYKLTLAISKEYEIQIDNSSVLASLLNHLVENYPPQNLFYTFKYMAREVIIYMHKERKPEYISKHYFSKFVGDYIQYIENKGYELKKTWTLPPEVQTTPFEALFSQLYLNGHFDWNRLSAKEIARLWMENIGLTDNTQTLLDYVPK